MLTKVVQNLTQCWSSASDGSPNVGGGDAGGAAQLDVEDAPAEADAFEWAFRYDVEREMIIWYKESADG